MAPLGYLIGGTNFNRELFLWRLPDCSLVQTIRFCPNEERDQEDGETVKASPQPMLITSFSAAANLLLASDIKRTVGFLLSSYECYKSSIVDICSLDVECLTPTSQSLLRLPMRLQ